MAAYLFTSCFRDYFRRARLLLWIGTVIGVFAIAKVFLQVNPNVGQQDAYIMLTSILGFRILSLAAAVMAAGVIANEVSGKTIVYLLTRNIPRWQLITFRTFAAMAAVALLSILAVIATSFAVYGNLNSLVPKDILAVTLGSMAYVGFFVAITLLVNKAMVYLLLFAFGWEVAVPNMPGDIFKLSINSYVSGAADHPKSGGGEGVLALLGGMIGTQKVPFMASVAVLLGIGLVTMAFNAYWFTSNEFIAREDAE